MRTSVIEIAAPTAESLMVTDDTLSVDLNDGRTIAVPLVWFPRLLHATPEERNHWRLIGKGHGIHGKTLMRISVLRGCWQVDHLVRAVPPSKSG